MHAYLCCLSHDNFFQNAMCRPRWYHFSQGLCSSLLDYFLPLRHKIALFFFFFLAFYSPFRAVKPSFLWEEASRFCKNSDSPHSKNFASGVLCSVILSNEHKNLLPWADRGRILTSACAPAPLSSLGASQLFHSWLADGKRWEQTGRCSGFLWQSSRIALSSS